MLRMLHEINKNTSIPVTLLTAEDLMLIIDTKLQNTDIGHKQLQSLFVETGRITRERISEIGL